MSKERRTVTIEPEVNKILAQEGVNASQLVNKLVKNHATSGGDKRSMLELREEQLVSDIEELETRIESKEDQLADVREQLAEFQTEEEQKLRQAEEVLSERDIATHSQAFEFWADELDMSHDELAEAIDGGVRST